MTSPEHTMLILTLIFSGVSRDATTGKLTRSVIYSDDNRISVTYMFDANIVVPDKFEALLPTALLSNPTLEQEDHIRNCIMGYLMKGLMFGRTDSCPICGHGLLVNESQFAREKHLDHYCFNINCGITSDKAKLGLHWYMITQFAPG